MSKYNGYAALLTAAVLASAGVPASAASTTAIALEKANAKRDSKRAALNATASAALALKTRSRKAA